MRTKLGVVIAAVSMLGTTAGIIAITASPAVASGPNTVVVSAGDIAPGGPWALEPSSNTGTYSFVSGPAPTPGGTGSLAMSVPSGGHEWLNNYAYGACATGPSCSNPPANWLALSTVDALGFSTYRASGTTYPSLNVEADVTGTGSSYTTLVFVPDSGQVTDGAWQSWDTMNASDGVWYSTTNLGTAPFNCNFQAAGCDATWAQIMTAFPNAKVKYGLGPNVGTGGTFAGNVDDLELGISGTTTVFDFEPDCTTTCYVDAATGNDLNSGLAGDPLQTIQAGVNKVSPGGTVQVAAGTYVENVTVPKSVDISGAGTSTIVEPASSNPNCGGGGGGSLCAGASSVFLVQSSNVTIDHLLVNGDNPGNGAGIDARNGIIIDHTAGPTYMNFSVHDDTVENIYLRGIQAGVTGGSFTIANNTVSNVQGDASESLAIANFDGSGTISGNSVSNSVGGIVANYSEGTHFTNNTVTTSGSGVQTSNAGGDGVGPADVISGNHVSACTAGGYGLWSFVPYLAPTFSGNTVSGCDNGMVSMGSCDLAGTNSCPGGVIPTVIFASNNVTSVSNGNGLYVTTNTFGFGDGEVKTTATLNTFSGPGKHIYVEETGIAHSTVKALRNSVRSVINTGSTTLDGRCNWWGASTGAAAGQYFGPVMVAPYLTSSNLAAPCLPIASLGATPVRTVEGNSGTHQVQLTVTLNGPSTSPATVSWNTSAGTAATTDFHGASGSLTFAPGQTTKTITVVVVGDTILEGNENFPVNIHAGAGAAVGVAKQFVVILNDEKPTMSLLGPVSISEGTNGQFAAHLAQPYYQPITISIATINGTAHSGSDYGAVSASITFPAGVTTQPLPPFPAVHVNADGLNEGAETFVVRLTSSLTNNSPLNKTITIPANHS